MNTELRERLLKALPLNKERVEVPGWGPTWVRELDGHGRSVVEHAASGVSKDPTQGLKRYEALHVVLGVVDDNDAPVFTEADVDALLSLPSRTLRCVFRAVQRLSALDTDAKEEARGN